MGKLDGRVAIVTGAARGLGAAAAEALCREGAAVMLTDGLGIRDAIVKLTGPNTSPLTARTNALGYFRFDNVLAGETYVLSVTSKRYAFTPRTLSIVDEIADLVLIAN